MNVNISNQRAANEFIESKALASISRSGIRQIYFHRAMNEQYVIITERDEIICLICAAQTIPECKSRSRCISCAFSIFTIALQIKCLNLNKSKHTGNTDIWLD